MQDYCLLTCQSISSCYNNSINLNYLIMNNMRDNYHSHTHKVQKSMGSHFRQCFKYGRRDLTDILRFVYFSICQVRLNLARIHK